MIAIIYDGHHDKVKPTEKMRSIVKVSREHMAENRVRILTEAARLFRDKGFESVTVAQVMKAAGLTHGAFYGHFASKDDLIAETTAHALKASSLNIRSFNRLLEAYLSPQQRDNPSAGCPTAAFASDVRRQTAEAREAMSAGIASQVAQITTALDKQGVKDARSAAIGSWSAMVGAMILARSIEDTALSDEILKETRAWIKATLQD
jgi:TetR/AcrR family transcriptional regulator, transcriptional repressor for nem operon